ncbi:YlmC/YmxH family sporulation protein [Haloplasma contractile]|uniref:PRC-barrel protein n=1 Tax=Haloplasma contractile SSD-17B TaxID=1033810 RepID=U2EF98_9MOLU|nr:YlmC/YmxH family sporulation protein [Haloplasma contractile]ERJ13608.1 PRC-barrel protein [Haloplasma contractile SSD-17B]
MLFTEICEKEVVNVINGKAIGNVVDLEIEPNSGRIFFIYVQQIEGLLSIFNKPEKLKIPWNQIVKIGVDVIIVNFPFRKVDDGDEFAEDVQY